MRGQQRLHQRRANKRNYWQQQQQQPPQIQQFGVPQKKEEDQETGESTVGTQAVQTAIDPKALEAGESVGAQV